MKTGHLDADWVRRMEGVPVLVAGDIMLDRFVYGAVERISPESPVPVLSVTRENMMLGGAGNTLSNLVHLKCSGKILSVVGDDGNGRAVRDLAQKLGIDISGLMVAQDRPTIVKTRFLAGHQQLLRTDFEQVRDLPKALEQEMLEKAKGLLADVKAVILSDYGKGVLTQGLITGLIQMASEKGILVLVDPKGRDYGKYCGADVVTPNKKELSEASGMKTGSDEEIVEAAKKVMQSSGVKAVVATRSKDGISIIAGGAPVHIRSAADIEVFDVSGAGDSVIATIAGALAASINLVDAVALANLAGSIVVSKVGTAPIRSEELIAAIGMGNAATACKMQAPVLDWPLAKEEVQRWRARGYKVGFTNGCFDILHRGHVGYLNAARRKCDRLVVGLNHDASVRILKGAERPVHDGASRAAVLAGLGAVDMVVLFGAQKPGADNTACALLETLQPDVYFKGGDYTVEQIPEAPTVIRYGGVVEVMPVSEGHSTTNSIKKIRAL